LLTSEFTSSQDQQDIRIEMHFKTKKRKIKANTKEKLVEVQLKTEH
jgi:hypothetical protein